MDDAVEKSAMRKIYMRLLPFAILSYVLAYIDRINVSFAASMVMDCRLAAPAGEQKAVHCLVPKSTWVASR